MNKKYSFCAKNIPYTKLYEKHGSVLNYLKRSAFLTVVVYSLSEHRCADANSVITLIDGGFRRDPPNIACIIFSILRLLRNYYYHERHLCHGHIRGYS